MFIEFACMFERTASEWSTWAHANWIDSKVNRLTHTHACFECNWYGLSQHLCTKLTSAAQCAFEYLLIFPNAQPITQWTSDSCFVLRRNLNFATNICCMTNLPFTIGSRHTFNELIKIIIINGPAICNLQFENLLAKWSRTAPCAPTTQTGVDDSNRLVDNKWNRVHSHLFYEVWSESQLGTQNHKTIPIQRGTKNWIIKLKFISLQLMSQKLRRTIKTHSFWPNIECAADVYGARRSSFPHIAQQ